MGYDADAMAVATATSDGAPSARMVLLKGVDERGLVFFTNYSSRKGAELEPQPARGAALPLASARAPGACRRRGVAGGSRRERGVRAQPAEAEPAERARLPSERGRPGPRWLERRVEELAREHPEGDLPLRDDWGGFRVAPDTWEFWEHRDNRLHDRHRYTRGPDGWQVERLAP